jgi:hypothetical protein
MTMLWVCCIVLMALPVFAQGPLSDHTPDAAQSIQDNSFLLEEAYNQEEGAVQHASTFMRHWRKHQWVYTFSQEWPVVSQQHQLSYTIPVQGLDTASSTVRGLGDIALSYRYQLVGSGDTPLAVAPRFSLLVPTGNARKDLGAGALGWEFSVPVSVEIGRYLVTHVNVGLTFIPSAHNSRSDTADLLQYSLGQSIIWLVKPTFNIMLEFLWESQETVIGPGKTQRDHSVLLSPGIRWAHNLPNGLQIVPGIAVPLGIGPSRGERNIFIYLSFEHPFKSK